MHADVKKKLVAVAGAAVARGRRRARPGNERRCMRMRTCLFNVMRRDRGRCGFICDFICDLNPCVRVHVRAARVISACMHACVACLLSLLRCGRPNS